MTSDTISSTTATAPAASATSAPGWFHQPPEGDSYSGSYPQPSPPPPPSPPSPPPDAPSPAAGASPPSAPPPAGVPGYASVGSPGPSGPSSLTLGHCSWPQPSTKGRGRWPV